MQPWEREGAELIKYKPALLQDVRVNYAPNGIPSFFAGTNLPTFIQIGLTFVETTYFTANDFGREDTGDGDAISELVTAGTGLINDFLPGDTTVQSLFETVDGVAQDAIDSALGDDNE